MSILSLEMLLGPGLMSASRRSSSLVEFHLESILETSKISILPSLGSSEMSVAVEDQRSPSLVKRRGVEEKMRVLSERCSSSMS